MLFNSIHFLIFFPIVVGIYFILPHKYRWVFLLLSSYYFYMSWKPEYALLIIFATLVDYLLAIQIEKAEDKKRKKFFLSLSLSMNLGVLFFFKYFNFFSESTSLFLKALSIQFDPIMLKVILPVGISFYTFQSMSYTIDVYRGVIKAERHLGVFATFISFFPQLVAGPIGRAKDLMPQFYRKNEFDYERITSGLKLMLWGLYKKIVIADRVAIVVNQVFNNVTDYQGIPLLMAVFLFSAQVYCDFSGYSDIAIGSARIMGYDLMKNFNRPYLSRSIAEFWRRWHISLSSWFQDYVFTPMYLEISKFKLFKNISSKTKHFLVFSISIILGEALLGLWHGAAWTYVFFGLYHGFLIALYYVARKYWDKMYNFIKVLITFILVSMGYIFFRSANLENAFYVFTHLFTGVSLDFGGMYLGGLGGWLGLKIALAPVIFFVIFELLDERYKIVKIFEKSPRVVRWSGYLILIFWILLFGVFEEMDFIYFQF